MTWEPSASSLLIRKRWVEWVKSSSAHGRQRVSDLLLLVHLYISVIHIYLHACMRVDVYMLSTALSIDFSNLYIISSKLSQSVRLLH